MSNPETSAETADVPDWAQAVDWIDTMMADEHVIGYPLEWLRTVLVAASDLERERDEARRELRALEWISEFGWLAGYPERGAVTRAIPESHRMSGFKSHTEAALALGREPTPVEKT